VRTIPARRLLAQELVRPRFATPAELVSWMGAVQAQDYQATKRAVGVRLRQKRPTDIAVERALDEGAVRPPHEGSVLRTHVFRWTWQLVTPADVRWMLALVGSRLVNKYAKRHRELEIDRRLVIRSQTAFEKALRHGDSLTRDELGEALATARIVATGPRLAHLLALAELESVVCSGARRGKHHTYALLDHRAPESRLPSREASLAELARRYFQSRGPATVADFVWWTGLAPADARNAIEAIQGSLEAEEIDGQTYHSIPDARRKSKRGHVELVPAFDEWLVAYRNRNAVLDPAQAKRLNAGGGLLAPSVIVDGRVIGIWRRELSRDAVSLLIDCFEPASATTKRAIVGAAERYAAFLGLEPKTRFSRLI
jgi:hypothetical protein